MCEESFLKQSKALSSLLGASKGASTAAVDFGASCGVCADAYDDGGGGDGGDSGHERGRGAQARTKCTSRTARCPL